ncbi:MAG: translation initiation factor IF-2 [Bdellovibrionales bacterium]|nr:translation initiation factor IF-2 [Bdellovibrionales bacterium]
MTQLKVFEFAKEIGVETLALMDKIREWKLPVRSHMATLDEAMMSEIRTRLSQASAAAEEASKPKKKAVRKKAAAADASPGTAAEAPAPKAKTAKAAAPKKAAVKKAAASKTTTTKAATTAAKTTASAAAVAVPSAEESSRTPRASTVIRRKAGEAEAKALEAAQAEAAAQAAAAEAQQQAEISGEYADPASMSAQASEVDTDSGTAAAAAPVGAAEAPKRRNIVGRMDLRRVATIQGPRGSGAAGGGGAVGADGQPRIQRTAPRNIRTGFYSADPMGIPGTQRPDDVFAAKEREEKAKRRPGAGGGKEEEQVQVFTATEFRKREVIFQPKKKKSMVGGASKKTQITTPAAHKRIVKVEGTISLSALAAQMGVKAPALMKKLMQEGVQASMNTDLDFDTVALIAPEFGWEAQNTVKSVSELISETAFGDLNAEQVVRAPVVTVMGHVDHGKTSLLDAIRKADVASGEAGGITQHIGAYNVTLEDGSKITFIDTPGHEAFTAMRARGANVTDIAIIVVAADDGMMPQTQEAVNHAKAAGVPIIVAINKMDKPGANPERIKQQLTELELVPEEWGGTTMYVPVSALKRTGIKELLEQIHLVAEVQELKANPKRSGTGIVIESRMEKGRGIVATLLVKDGTVTIGQTIVAGTVVGRVRQMSDDTGKTIKEAGPGTPVEILGLPETPQAGDSFDIAKDESSARAIAEQRLAAVKVAETPNSKMSLEQLFARVKSGDVKELSLIMKADVAGSLEAIKGMLDKLGNEEVKVKLVHSAVGGITESDVLLASTAKGVIVGFNVRPDGGAARMAKEKGIEIKSYSIIYELMDDLKKSLGGLLAPTIVEKSMGRAEVRNTFVVPKMGTIAGCFVTDGKIVRNNQLRLVRDGKIIFEGKVSSLKRFKDDAREVASGFECGIGIENYNDIKVGDVIESFVKEEQVREL